MSIQMTDSRTLRKQKQKQKLRGESGVSSWEWVVGFFFFCSFLFLLLSGCWCGSLSICSGNCDVCSWAGSEVLEPFSKRAGESTLQHLVIERLACGAELVRMRQVPMGSRLLLVLSFILVWGSSVQGKTLPPLSSAVKPSASAWGVVSICRYRVSCCGIWGSWTP